MTFAACLKHIHSVKHIADIILDSKIPHTARSKYHHLIVNEVERIANEKSSHYMEYGFTDQKEAFDYFERLPLTAKKFNELLAKAIKNIFD